MNSNRALFEAIPDTVIITDTYGYVLDFNKTAPFSSLKKGEKLSLLIPDCFSGTTGEFSYGDRIFKRYTTKLDNGKNDTGYTILLSDVTEEAHLTEQRQKKSDELAVLEQELMKSNAEITEYVMRIKELADYSEQLRIAQNIHDGHGHALTELYTICRMIGSLKDRDPQKCHELLKEGVALCRRAQENLQKRELSSLRGFLEDFASENAFRTVVSFEGDEPSFMNERRALVASICKEAYHNTLSHSMADTFIVKAVGKPDEFTITLTDNGSFRGEFEKGFGLTAMEENVRSSGGEIVFTAENGKGFGITAKWRNNHG